MGHYTPQTASLYTYYGKGATKLASWTVLTSLFSATATSNFNRYILAC